jgi:hypothetical protein
MQRPVAADRGGREVAMAGGWREVEAALEDGSVKGGGGCNEGDSGFAVPLFLSLLTFSLFTFHFSEHLKRRAKKKRLKKKGHLFKHFYLRIATFYFPHSRTLEQTLTVVLQFM